MEHGIWAIKRPKGITWHNISVHGVHRGKGLKDIWISYYEIFGNIYENEDLLKLKCEK